MNEHNPYCDVNDVGPDGIKKPCNCKARGLAVASEPEPIACFGCGAIGVWPQVDGESVCQKCSNLSLVDAPLPSAVEEPKKLTVDRWERILGFEIISHDGFRDLRRDDLITEKDFRDRLVHATQNLRSVGWQLAHALAATSQRAEMIKVLEAQLIGIKSISEQRKSQRDALAEQVRTLTERCDTLRELADRDASAAGMTQFRFDEFHKQSSASLATAQAKVSALQADKDRLDWLDDFFSITRESSDAWKNFYSLVSEKGFRKAITIWMENYGVNRIASTQEGAQ